MRLDIRGRALELTPAIDDYVARRMRFAVGRFETRLRRVTVRVGDENGPRGGVDKFCRAVVPTSVGTFVVEEKDRDLYAAIDRASERLRRSVRRAILRSRKFGKATLRGGIAS